jgi:uncharacterized repeat protein (TIGR01451 family)
MSSSRGTFFVPAGSRAIRFLVLLAVATGLLVTAAPAQAATAFAPGSYIIPMDTTYQNQGMFKAYGLVYRLLQKGVPVSWAIKPGKAFGAVDFSATTNDVRTAAVVGPVSYSGGPFIISSANAAAALPIIQAWWLANANQPNVHTATAGFSADIDIVLNRAPRIALEQTNSGIAMAYFAAAGIPDDNGAAWSSTSPNIFDEARIASGALLDPGGGCPRTKWDVFVTPHNGGYGYSLTDPTNLGTRTYAELDKFVFYGGGWIAMCHSILSNENAVSDLYRNGNPGVRALFLSTQNTGFLTQAGFGANIVNKGGAYSVSGADLPIGQAVATPGATQALPGGSVQTWQSVAGGTPTGVQYLAGVERVAWFASVGKQYDHVANGVYHGGDGRGKLSFIGGHSYATTLPYSTNYEAPYVRFFLNALYFNGAAVAHLVLESSVPSVTAGIPSNFQVRLKNGGASTATGISNTSITLAAGVVYSGMGSGPFPDCDPIGALPSGCSGGVLTWNRSPGLIVDVPGGASGLAVNVSNTYLSPAAPPISPPNVATMVTNYGDNFNESFKGGDCLSITVLPAPVPAITKTRVDITGTPGDPSDEYVAGNVVYWKLAYANTGAADLLNAVVEDVVPGGFAVDSTTTPAPASVAPQGAGTTRVKWNLGTLAAGASGTITLGTIAPVIGSASQTFTNSVTLSGFDAAGVPYSTAPATDTATVIKPSVDPGKTVDKATANPGDTLTYTIVPVYTGSVLLTNATVTDPIPTNTAYLASSANADGFLDTSVAPNQVTWNLGSNAPQVNGATPPVGYAYCPATATFDTNTGVTDTYIDFNQRTSNFGNVNELLTRPANASRLKYTLVRFNLGATIPAGSLIQSALFKLTVKTAKNKNHFDTVRRLITDWTEGGATWNRRDGTNNWAAGAFSSADYAPTNYGSFVPKNGGVQYSVDVAGAVSTWINTPASNFGLALISTGTDASDAKYYSDEETNATRRPVLVVTYLRLVGPIPPGTTCSGSPTTLTSVADTYIEKGNVTNNHATSKDLFTNPGNNNATNNTNHSLIRFDLSAIPPGATITSAFLKVNVTARRNVPTHIDEIHRMTTAWTETGATWSRRNGINSWAAGNFSGADYAATVYNTIAPTANGTTTPCGPQGQYCRDVTTLVDDWVNNGFVNNGIALVSTGADNNDAKYSSREDTGLEPQLIVTWTVPPATVDPTTTSLNVSPLLLAGPGNVTVTMTVSSAGNIGTVTPPANLTVVPGASTVAKVSGPTPATAVVNNSSATFTWVYSVTPGTAPDDTLYFAGKPVSSTLPLPSGARFLTADSPSVIVTPPLTYQVTIANPLVPTTTQQITNVATFSDDTAVGSQDSQPAVTTILRPQLSITKANAPTGIVNPGDVVTYTLVLTNSGVGSAPAVVITDAVPANSTFFSCGVPACTSSPAVGGNGNVVWNLGTVAANTVVTRTFQVRASTSPTAPFTILNSAQLTATGVPAFFSNAVTNSLNATPSIEIVKSNNVVTPTVSPGGAIQYTLVIRNTGLLQVSGVVMTDVLPAGTTFVNCVAPGCTTAPAAGATSGTMTWNAANIGTIAAGGTVTRSFNVTVSAGQVDGGSIVNGASLTATGLAAPVQSNLVTNPVSAPPRIAVTKSASPAPGNVGPGQVITYTLTVTNNGPGYTSDAVVSDAIPAGTSYVANSTRFIAANSAACPVDEVTPGVAPIAGSLPVYSPPAVCPTPGDPAGTDGGTLYVNPPIALPVAAQITFQVRVNDPIATGTSISNTAVAAVGSPSAPCTASPALVNPPYCINSNTVVHNVPSPTVALTVTKVADSLYPIYDPSTWPTCEQIPDGMGGFTSVNCAHYRITVTNAGPNWASNFSISEALPTGLSSPQFTPSQGSVTGTGPYVWQVSGAYNDPLGPPGLMPGGSATLLVAARLCDALGLSGPADTTCLSDANVSPLPNGQVNSVHLNNSEQVDINAGTPALRDSSATVWVLRYTPATLRGLRVDPASGRVQFATGSQTSSRGFHVWISDPKRTAMARLTENLIPALVPSSMTPIVYEATLPPFTARVVFLEEIDLSGRSRMMGPFEVGDARLERAFDLVARKLLDPGGVARRPNAHGGRASMSTRPVSERPRMKKSDARTAEGRAAAASGTTKAAKILTSGHGWVSVPRSQFAALGLPAKTALGSVKVTSWGQPVATTVSGEGTPAEELRFMASPIDTVYSGRNAYLASWGSPARPPLVSLTLPETPPPSGYVRAQGHGFFAAQAPREINPWVWDWIWGDGSWWPYPDFSRPFANHFDLPGLVTMGSGTASVRVSFWMLTPDAHEFEAQVNGVPLGVLRTSGTGTAALIGDIPLAALRASGNELTVRYTSPSGTLAFSCIRHIEVAAPFDFGQVRASVEAVTAYDPSLPSTKGADYLILTHSAFADAAERLARLKVAEGYRPVVVDAERVYDAYSAGVFEASALQRFIADVYGNRRLAYVALLGEDTADPRDFSETGAFSFIPSISGWDGQFGRVASENFYADIDGDRAPDLAMGRLPAATPEEASLMIDKIARQETVLRASLGRNLFAADNRAPADPDFAGAAAAVSRRFPATAWSRVGDGIDRARSDLFAGWASGVSVVHFFGHGGPQVWTDEGLLTSAEASTMKSPEAVVLHRACLTQLYQYLGGASLGESLMLNPEGGALASFGPAGITNTKVQQVLFDRLYDEMLASPGIPLGEAIRRAKRTALGDDVDAFYAVEGFNLLGDPAIRLDGVAAAVKVR